MNDGCTNYFTSIKIAFHHPNNNIGSSTSIYAVDAIRMWITYWYLSIFIVRIGVMADSEWHLSPPMLH